MTIIHFPVQPSPLPLDELVRYTRPQAVEWAVERIMPDLLEEGPLEDDFLLNDSPVLAWDAREDVCWDVLTELLAEWLQANDLTIADLQSELLAGAA